MATKHDQIIQYIDNLPVGDRISVRTIAKQLGVSEGTAYRAIKDAEIEGLVSTIQRVGTIRIERKSKENIEKLTFEEVVKIVDGDVLGGMCGLDKELDKFIIGAMETEAILRYISSGSLMIVGNRLHVQKQALENGAAVLITGGFDTEDDIKALSDQTGLPIISTTYDTFTVATMINRALSDQMIKKEIMVVGDIQTPLDRTNYLFGNNTIEDYNKLSRETYHTRIPIVNKHMRLLGIVTTKDVIDKDIHTTLDRVMTRETVSVKQYMSVASVAHMMIWDGYELMPVVADDLILEGVVSRQDVLKSLQLQQRQPQIADTFSDQITNSLEEKEDNNHVIPHDACFEAKVTPQMVSTDGMISFGVLSEMIANAIKKVMNQFEKRNTIIEQVNLTYLKQIQLESTLKMYLRILDVGRRSSKIDVEVYIENSIVAKAVVVCHIIER